MKRLEKLFIREFNFWLKNLEQNNIPMGVGDIFLFKEIARLEIEKYSRDVNVLKGESIILGFCDASEYYKNYF